MRADRARKIAAAFSQAGILKIRQSGGGLQVSFCGEERYFSREALFWPFIYRLAGVIEERAIRDGVYRA